MTINAQNRLLPDWFTRIRTRQTVLPRFQRFEAWSHSTVTQLFNTILQGLPVGAVLVLEIGNEEPFVSRTIVGAPTEGERITEHLLDGQQRLTALWRALHNNYDRRTYFVYLLPDEETGMPYFIDSIGRWKNDGDKETRPFWANDPAQQWARKMIPLDLVAPGDEASSRYKEWARQAIEDADEREDVAEIRTKISQQFATFNLPFLSLPVTTPKDVALDVFIKMNTSAAPLKIYDIVVAQVEAGHGKSLHDLVASIKTECPNISEYYEAEDLTLYASALLQGKPPTNKTYLGKDFGKNVLENWDDLISGIMRAEVFLEEERIFDSARLPTDIVVPVLAALWARTPDGLDAEGRARLIFRKYMWRAFFSGRYEKSTNSRALSDYLEIRALLDNQAAVEPAIFDLQQYPLPKHDELVHAGWPTKKDRIARAILALALREGGHDLADGSTVSRTNLKKREYHHLFPDAYLTKLGLPSREVFRSLNCALITWKTNRSISAKEPERYLSERLEGSDVSEQDIRQRLATHLVPYDEMKAGDYDKFLKKRAEMVFERMQKVCGVEESA